MPRRYRLMPAACRSIPARLLAAACGLAALAPAAAQPAAAAGEDVERMVRDGLLEALDARLAGGRNPTEKRWLADAARNRALRASTSEARESAYQDAERRYKALIDALERASDEPPRKAADVAAARIDLCGMILSHWVAPIVDEFEITRGQRGDRRKALSLLQTARQQAEVARDGIAAFLRDLDAHEEEYLALGVFDTFRRLRADTQFHLGWACAYLGLVEPAGDERAAVLRTAEQCFQTLIAGGQAGPALQQCLIGQGIALREQQRGVEAERLFAQALEDGSDPVATAQARYELARCQIRAARFEEGRETLGPLLTVDPENLSPAERGAALFYNLAALWDANSFLEQAVDLQRRARDGADRNHLLKQALRMREAGLARMNRLSARGGAWPGIVQLYVATAVDANADAQALSPLELLFLAGQLSDARRYAEAADRLEAAAARPGVDAELAGQVLFDLGVCRYRLNDYRVAATAFARLARERREHPRAAQAAGFAYQLWVKVAEQTKAHADYEELAATLLNLVQSFPQHDERLNAMWGLPLALQAADRFADAAAQFANVPAESPHWEEAQFRRVICLRLACEAERATLAAPDFLAQARRTAAELIRYAQQALNRAVAAADADGIRKWSAEALVSAAELLISPGVEQPQSALTALEAFEQSYPNSPALGRALAVRLRCYAAASDFSRATAALDSYLAAAAPEQAAAILTVLSQAMQSEVERLQRAARGDEARSVATNAVKTFEELDRRLRSDPARAREADLAAAGLAQMLRAAGAEERAAALIAELLQRNPQNGHLRRLHALSLTAALAADSPPERIAAALEAWAALLRDSALRETAPQRYWEARHQWLTLLLRQGKAADVARAIEQERVWYPDLGGPEWRPRLEELLARAKASAAP